MKSKIFTKKNKFNQSGDTLVEVAIAIAVMGMVVAGTSAIAQRSILNIQDTIDTTTVRGHMRGQEDMLRYVFKYANASRKGKGDVSYSNAKQIVNQISEHALNSEEDNTKDPCHQSDNSFYLTVSESNDQNKNIAGAHFEINVGGNMEYDYTSSSSPKPGNGVWFEAIHHSGNGTLSNDYYDFYIKSCWTPHAAINDNTAHMLSIVRIYGGN